MNLLDERERELRANRRADFYETLVAFALVCPIGIGTALLLLSWVR